MPITEVGPFVTATTNAKAADQGQAWTNPTNGALQDGAIMSAQGFDDPVTDTQAFRVTTSGTIPSNATIESVTVVIRGRVATIALGLLSAELWADSAGSLGSKVVSNDADTSALTTSLADYTVTIPKASFTSQAAVRNAFNAGHMWVSVFGTSDGDGATFEVDSITLSQVQYSSPTQNYNRPKSVTTNDTPIDFSVKASESPNAVDTLPNAGNSAIVDVLYRADADESGSADVQDIAKFTFTPSLSADGTLSLGISFTAVSGAGVDGTPQTATVLHTQGMNAWQSAAGRAPQA